MWLAGGGVRGGMAYGATDEFGFKAEDNPMHVHDLHATLLHLMGFDHEKLTFRHAGRDFRLTDVRGHVVHEMCLMETVELTRDCEVTVIPGGDRMTLSSGTPVDIARPAALTPCVPGADCIGESV